MCGIFGIYRLDKETVKSDYLTNMLSKIKHRGPDGDGQYIDECIGIGHCRLSIIDLSELGNQPMSFGDNLWITFNGEIYNYLEIRSYLENKGFKFKSQTDTEIILILYSQYGYDCVKFLRGMFSFVIFDKNKKELFCARDRFGIKPFYYYKSSDKFVYASEIKSILSDNSIPSLANEKIISDFLYYNRTDHSSETSFKDIMNLLPGHYLVISKNEFRIKKWYSLPKNFKTTPRSQQVRNFMKDLYTSIRLHLRSDVEVGAALSGGLDSSTIATIMRETLGEKRDISTFSAVYDSNWTLDEKKYVDEVNERVTALPSFVRPEGKELVENLENLIKIQEEPFGSSSIFAGWKVMQEVNKKGIKVILNGQGADEILGYDYMSAFYFFELINSKKYFTALKEITSFAIKQKRNVSFTLQLLMFLLLPSKLRDEVVQKDKPWIHEEFKSKLSLKSEFYKNFFKVTSLNESVERHLRYKLNHLLRVEDKNSMAFSVEARVPFLDHKLVERSLATDSSLKIHNGQNKYILRQIMKNKVPDLVLERNNKVGFDTPQSNWFKEEYFMTFATELFTSSTFKERKIFNSDIALSYLNKHSQGKKDYSEIIWKILYVELWYRIFIDKKIT